MKNTDDHIMSSKDEDDGAGNQWTKKKIAGAVIAGGVATVVGAVIAAPFVLGAVGLVNLLKKGKNSHQEHTSDGMGSGVHGAAVDAGVATVVHCSQEEDGKTVHKQVNRLGMTTQPCNKLADGQNVNSECCADDKDTCVVCQDDKVCIVFLPCGHICTCRQCSLDMKICPLCRENIGGKHRIYLP